MPAIRVKFAPHQNKYHKSITVIGFLQPHMIENIILKNEELRNKKDLQQTKVEGNILGKRKIGRPIDEIKHELI